MSNTKDKSRPLWDAIAALKDPDWMVRCDAIFALRDMRNPRAVEPLAEALADGDSFVRLCAAAALAEFNDLRAIQPLASETEREARLYATPALCKISNVQAVRPLLEALTEKNRDMFNGICYALEENAKAALNDPNPDIRQQTITALRRVRLNQVVPPLRATLAVDPCLPLEQCGLPEKLALDLYWPLFCHRFAGVWLERLRWIVNDPKGWHWHWQIHADDPMPTSRECLAKLMNSHPVVIGTADPLNLAGLRSFSPVLVAGEAVTINPLLASSFQTSFAGDDVWLYVPLSTRAQQEARERLSATAHLFSPAAGQPLVAPSGDIVLGCYYLTCAMEGARGEGHAFASIAEVLFALDAKEVSLQARIRLRCEGKLLDLDNERDTQDLLSATVQEVPCRTIQTTVGRVIFNEHLPEGIPYVNGLLKRKGLASLIHYCSLHFGQTVTLKLLAALPELGQLYATQSGLSIGLDDLVTPSNKASLLAAAAEVNGWEKKYQDGYSTNGERLNAALHIWGEVTEKIADEMFRAMHQREREQQQLNPLLVMADSGAGGGVQQLRRLAGMYGLMTKSSGECIEMPIRTNFCEGLGELEYFLSACSARQETTTHLHRRKQAEDLLSRLAGAVSGVVITERDCGTSQGILAEPVIECSDIKVSLSECLVGRVVAEDVYVPGRGEVLIRQGEAISYEVAREIQSAGFACLRIRSPLSCAARRGVCANCYGVHPATGKLVEVGEAVGLITAQIISESSQELTERIFNICGRGTWRVEQTSYEARASGRIKYDQLNTVKNSEGMIVVMNRNGSVVIVDDRGREVDRYPIAYGTALNFADGTQCEEGDKLAEWDPYSRVILTEVTGHVHWKDLIEGETVHEDTDKDTGLSRNIVMDSTNEKRQPRIEIRNDAGKVLKVYPMPIRANLMVGRDDRIEAGDVLARIPRETRPLRDVPCGLPLLIQLLEAQAPPYSAVMSESAGIVRLSQRHDGGREVTVMAEDGTMRVYQFPRHTHINVSTGDRVRVGEPLTDGPLNHHDILAILGKPYLQQHLLGELRENFSLNGISFDDKHLEIIVREMLCRVQVTDPGDSAWQRGQKVTWQQFSAENQRVLARGGHPAQARPMLIGLQELQRMKIRCPFAPSPDA